MDNHTGFIFKHRWQNCPVYTYRGQQIQSQIILPIIIGAILTVGAIANFVMLPHPAWFVVVGLLIFVPFTLLGHKAVPSR